MEDIFEDLRNGKIILVSDDENRENEADMICAGENVTGENVNIMASFGKGLICTPMSDAFAKKFKLNQMVANNTDNHSTAFTVSIDHISTTTGISAFERAKTIRELCNDKSKPEDFRRPGHVFPLVARDGGVLTRQGHTEATVDLLTMAELKPVGLCCEIMDIDGHMMRGKKVEELAEKFGFKFTSVAAIKAYKENHFKLIERTNAVNLPTDYGDFKAISFYDKVWDKEHLALIKGDIRGENVLTRIHSECLTGDVFASKRCDCGSQLHEAMRKIDENGRGVLLYMRQEGRGIGLFNKIKAYDLQDHGYDTVDANLELGFDPDQRDYKIAVEILKELGVKSLNLMTNNPDKIEQVEKYKLRVNKRIPIEIKSNGVDKKYLKTKVIRMRHQLREFKEV
ncbi:MAG: GTP cyclohydrolase II [Peptoniphilaceae bacterium]|nr:GTP cyclohydrolase II [Peptoniphilaceae bacterium]MDY6019434.1 GTP cyclohydrolase II [Anaerococcus sp.]